MATTNNFEREMEQITSMFSGSNYSASANDIRRIGGDILHRVDSFLTSVNAIHPGRHSLISVANESLSADSAFNHIGVDKLQRLVEDCGVTGSDRQKAAMEQVAIIMNRCLNNAGQPAQAWLDQNAVVDYTNTQTPESRSLETLYSRATINDLSNGRVSNEALGVNIDMAVPDMKVSITVAIMNFHTRLTPRLIPTRSTTQPNVAYTKERLEVYDLTKVDGDRRNLIDLYVDPSFASNELKRIIPLKANDSVEDPVMPAGGPEVDGQLLFGKSSNILRLSEKNEYGYNNLNRTDIIAENARLDYVYLSLNNGSTTEVFKVMVPATQSRLTRTINSRDTADRNADIRFNVVFDKTTQTAAGADSEILKGLADNEQLKLSFTLKPSLSLKYGVADCLGSVLIAPRHAISDDALLPSDDPTGATKVVTDLKKNNPTLVSYVLDARFSEENLRKTSIAMWTHRQPFSYDIPLGRNYVSDYLIGQANAEENATNLTKLIGIGQDHVAIKLLVNTADEIKNRLAQQGLNTDNHVDYVGASYVSGDKIIPYVFSGTMDFSKLVFIRSADRSGDIKQFAMGYLNAVTTQIMQNTLLQQQLGGSTTATFRCVCRQDVLGYIISQPHIHNHMNKEDARDLGDGVEYVIGLNNGIRLEFVTTTFNYMTNRLAMWPVIKNNAESELHYAHNWDYGTMVAHYTPSGEAAHHRLFANIRELPIVTTPIAAIIDIVGMDVVSGLVSDGTFYPTINTVQG